jgi:hypothetical protein
MKTYKKPKKNKKKTKRKIKGGGVKKTQLKTNEKKELFRTEQFTDFDSVIFYETKRIGNGKNGVIWSIPFRNTFTYYDYISYAVLKCNSRDDPDPEEPPNTNEFNTSDNLYYEYFVGKHFINKYINKFPCFVETYECYILSPSKWEELITKTSNVELNTGITKYTGDFSESCTNSLYLSVLIEHFDSANFYSLNYALENNNTLSNDTLKHMLKDPLYNIRIALNNIMDEIPCILYQIFFCLCSLGDSYTHYDLHVGNVFCYRPYDGKKYILMNYHKNDGSIISFPTQHIMKIIDYGRNYFNNSATNTNKILTTEICGNDKCETDCGYDFGYSMIQGDIIDKTDKYTTTPNKPNLSNDLRIIKNIISLIPNFENKYGISFIYDGRQHNNGYPDTIQTIYDAKKVFENIIKNLNLLPKYKSHWATAEMHIYEDGRDFEYNDI